MIGTKLKYLFLCLILLTSTAGAAEWTLTGCSELKRCNYTAGDQTVQIVDYNDDLILISIIENNSVVDTGLIRRGKSFYFNDDKSRVVSYTTNSAKHKIAVYTKIIPEFSVSSDTIKAYNTKFYDYVSTIYIKSPEQQVKNVKITFDSDNIKFTSDIDDIKYKSINKNYKIEKQAKYSVLNDPVYIITIEYEDLDGVEYTQKFNVLNNMPVIEQVEKEELHGVRVIQRDTREDREKRKFYYDIERALNNIEFSDSTRAELLTIQEQLKP